MIRLDSHWVIDQKVLEILGILLLMFVLRCIRHPHRNKNLSICM